MRIMFEQMQPGRFFIDRDGEAFKWVLRYLRNENTRLPTASDQCAVLREEADFYQVRECIASEI